ncbi:hypothetical protein HK19_15725 [Acetobacter persici]|nr:hypothetical protein HK19_15725 [Acetobacter persici]
MIFNHSFILDTRMTLRKAFLVSTVLTFGFAVQNPVASAATAEKEQKAVNAGPAKKAAAKKAKAAPHASEKPAAANAGETLIVTGTHAVNRKARQSTSPVSVLSAATLRRSGQMNLADALTRTYASINVSAMGNDAGSLTSAIRMRGLNPNQVLVLVDGKRRHTTANIYADAGPAFGATPVDLNMIPAASIDHIEVLVLTTT